MRNKEQLLIFLWGTAKIGLCFNANQIFSEFLFTETVEKKEKEIRNNLMQHYLKILSDVFLINLLQKAAAKIRVMNNTFQRFLKISS